MAPVGTQRLQVGNGTGDGLAFADAGGAAAGSLAEAVDGHKVLHHLGQRLEVVAHAGTAVAQDQRPALPAGLGPERGRAHRHELGPRGAGLFLHRQVAQV